MQKIKKILRAVFEKNCLLTNDQLTNCNGGNHRAQRQSLKKLETIGKVTNIELRMKQLKQIEKLRKGKC